MPEYIYIYIYNVNPPVSIFQWSLKCMNITLQQKLYIGQKQQKKTKKKQTNHKTILKMRMKMIYWNKQTKRQRHFSIGYYLKNIYFVRTYKMTEFKYIKHNYILII